MYIYFTIISSQKNAFVCGETIFWTSANKPSFVWFSMNKSDEEIWGDIYYYNVGLTFVLLKKRHQIGQKCADRMWNFFDLESQIISIKW